MQGLNVLQCLSLVCFVMTSLSAHTPEANMIDSKPEPRRKIKVQGVVATHATSAVKDDERLGSQTKGELSWVSYYNIHSSYIWCHKQPLKLSLNQMKMLVPMTTMSMTMTMMMMAAYATMTWTMMTMRRRPAQPHHLPLTLLARIHLLYML